MHTYTGMEITLNNSSYELAAHTTLYDIVHSQVGDKQKGIAVAVNDTVIPKADWERYTVQSNDNILIIKATQGG
jgi:sulfur carrier protein